MTTKRLTMAQAIILFLQNQYVERDGQENAFLCGLLGHFRAWECGGNWASFATVCQQLPLLSSTQRTGDGSRRIGLYQDEKSAANFRLHLVDWAGRDQYDYGRGGSDHQPLTCASAARRHFRRTSASTCLQQIEWEHSQDFSVNDCFKPVSRYWDRINRPEQIITALPEVMRVLTSPAETGAVTLALPQDVQAMAFDYPSHLFEKRVWHIPRNRPDLGAFTASSRVD